MDPRLLSILACPLCKGKLVLQQDELICRFDRLAYAIRDGVPIMLESEARIIPLDELPTVKGREP